MISEVKRIFDAEYGLEIYATLRKSQKITELQKLNLSIEDLEEIKVFLSSFIQEKFLAEHIETKTLNDIEEKEKCNYTVKLSAFSPYENINNLTILETIDDSKADGFLFKFGLDNNFFWAYQHIYQGSIIRKEKRIPIFLSGNNYKKHKGKVFIIEKRIDFISNSEDMIIRNTSLIESHFGFQDFIRKCSNEVKDKLIDLNLVSDISKIESLTKRSTLRFAKKLMKARNSKVFALTKNELIEKMKTHKIYSKIIDNDEIVINKSNDAELFLKMINDEFLKSELTGQEYDAPVKNIV